MYDAEDIVEERITGSSSDTIRYYHDAGIDEPLARKNSSDVVTYYLADHLGSVVQETNASGAVALEREYDPWGVAIQGASTSGHAFTGREWDAEIGLYFYRARYYEPGRARFLSDDPIGLAGGTNQQRYVSNSPTQFADPFGLQEYGKLPGTNIPYWNQQPNPNMHVTWRDGGESVISHEGGWLQTHGGKIMAKVPMKYRAALREVVGPFVKKSAKRAAKVAPVVTQVSSSTTGTPEGPSTLSERRRGLLVNSFPHRAANNERNRTSGNCPPAV